jgi:type IV pilus assembly protein PilM
MGSMTQQTTYFFEDKPLFGLDIGHGSVRVVQLDASKRAPRVMGYGEASFDPSAITDGVITKPEIIAEAIQELFTHHLVGDVSTDRVAVCLPIARAFTRSIEVPTLGQKDLAEAVQTEAEQYIPAALDELYIDYTQTSTAEDKSAVFIVAMPKRIVDSYLMLTRLLGLEAVVFQTSSGAGAQLFAHDGQSDVPTVLVDFGSDSADITVFDRGPVVSGTVACGGEQLTKAISEALNVTIKEATIIKTKYGLGYSKKQAQIETALNPLLSLLVKEIRRTIRYYEERSDGKHTISQVIITGGGANMLGLAEYFTNTLRLAVRPFDPTSYIDFGHLQPLATGNRMSYVSAVGLALTNPHEVFV